MRESRQPNGVIAIVDDDPSVREGLGSLIRSAALQVETFGPRRNFWLKGELSETDAHQLKWAWKNARSTLHGKDLIIEVSGVIKVAPAGIDLRSRIRQSGARISAAHLPECEELLRLLVCCER